ncbi:MAG: hypothetical protein AB7V27_10180 [Candidatus Binatia bacterium]
MLAVLEDALDCYQKYAIARDGHGQLLFEEANQWIASADRGWFFSYENICETLEINAEYLRRGLESWRRGAINGTVPVVIRSPQKAAAPALRAAS